MAGTGTGLVARLFAGRRAGTTLMIAGGLLAAAAFLTVLGMARQSQAAAAQSVRQVYIVTATRDIPQFTAIRADALAVKAFPAAFAPPGAFTKIEDVEGKFATTTIVRDQILLGAQASTTRRTSNLSASIPPGKVAFWMPMPDLLAASGGVQPGDRLDVLLSLTMTISNGGPLAPGKEEVTGVSTQTTLQNVEVFFAGSANNADYIGETPTSAPAGTGPAAARQAAKVIVFLLDPQDAVLAKWVKDSGGTIDLVLRSDTTDVITPTESVNADVVVDRFKFRVPVQWSTRK